MDSAENNARKTKWLRYAGAGAFVFFLAKGLLWLIVPALMWLAAK